jgi:hypothetical protein
MMFVNFNFSEKQIIKYFEAAQRDLRLAGAKEPEIKFFFSYNCLLKLAQAVCARNNLRVKQGPGHHIALLDKCANILKDDDLAAVAQTMRDKRNRDLYDGGAIITEKEASAYHLFVKKILNTADAYIFPSRKKLL